MFFSLDVMEEVLGFSMNKKEVKKSLREVQKMYKQERGILKACKVTKRRILFAFSIYKTACRIQKENALEMWKQFLEDCKEGGADFLEIYI